jgi:hypothetical protein
MSTFERMLQVLQDHCEASVDSGVRSAPAARGARRSGAKRISRRKLNSCLEMLEQRQVMAVSAFATAANGGLVTIVAEGGDNVYIQQVATSPQSLYVADNSSFAGRTVIGGPVIRASSPGSFSQQLLAGQNFNTIDQILITSGTKRSETLPQSFQGYPMISPSVTRFTLSGPGLDTFRSFFNEGPRLIEGRLSLEQPNGTTAFWDFSNFGDGLPRFTSGIGVSTTASTGECFPTSIAVVDANNFFSGTAKSSIEITWNVSSLTRVPSLDRVAWSQNHVTSAGSRTDTNVLPSAVAASARISLTNSTGPGLSTIIPSSFSGRLLVDGVPFDVTSSRNGTLYFNGQERGSWATSRGSGFTFEMSITGRLLDGSELDPVTQEYRRGIELTTSGPVTLSLVNAVYGVASGGDPVTATVFAGQNITAGLDINLLSPGSEINIDSPVIVPSTRLAHGVTLRASVVDVNAPLSVKTAGVENKVKVGGQEFNVTTVTRGGRVDIGPATANGQFGFEAAVAVAEVSAGQVQRVVAPTGLGGAGYDASRPPIVTVSAPQSVRAQISITGLVNGRVSSIALLAGGTGYAAPPAVVFDAPPAGAGSRVARGVAVIGANEPRAVVGVNIEDGGSGYTSAPAVRFVTAAGSQGAGAAATASIVGSLATSGVFVSDGGFGYVPGSRLALSIAGTGSGAAGYADVNAQGRVTGIVITDGGSGYDLQNTRITVPAPPPSQGRAAVVRAEVDPATTRVVRFHVDDPGSGYGSIPTVTVAPPVAAFAAAAPVATLANGSVAKIDFVTGRDLRLTVQAVSATGQVRSAYVGVGQGGSGYKLGEVVGIDSPRVGRSALFRIAQVSSLGAVLRVDTLSGGSGYTAGESLQHSGVAARGAGYTPLPASPPRVWVARPDNPNGRQATAVAVVGVGGSIERFLITDGGSGYTSVPQVTVAGLTPLAIAETARFNAAVEASVYDIELADDPFTPTERSQLLVSQGGSLRSDVTTVAAVGVRGQAAAAVRAEVHQGDVLVEGVVNAINQSYLLESGAADQRLAPFIFSTEAIGSGLQTGRIVGNDVAITLANDLPTPRTTAVAFNVVSLQTAVDSLRVRASRQNGTAIVEPFPYLLTIREESDIAIDALAASSFPISFTADGAMKFNAALATAGGFEITAQKSLAVNAPVSTTYGQIKLSGSDLTINASLRVTKEPVDEIRQDIILDASGGAITLRGGVVEAPGRVVMRQKSGRVPSSKTFGTQGSTPIVAGQTVSVPISVTDDFFFDDLAASISLAVTNPAFSLSNLSAELVSPNGLSYSLFQRFEPVGKAMTDTVFTPTATTRLWQSKEPYSGSFVPYSGTSLEQLYNRFSARGSWRLNVTSSAFAGTAGTVVGTVSAASLALRNPVGGLAGNVFGTSRINSNFLLIDAEGAVGNPAVQPSNSEFYLQTDVRSVEGTAGGSFSLADVNDVNVVALRANGLVSLRADGVDLPDGRAALRASLVDVPALDVSAIAGSIDVDVTTARSLEIGNAQLLSLAAPFRTGLPSMKAAGNVSIRTRGGSQGGGIVVLDAPLAGVSSRAVRLVADQSLVNAKYSAGVPGTYPARIDANGVGPLGSLLAGNPTLAIGDRVLVAGGVSGFGTIANGIYEVRNPGSASTAWQLVRATDADTLAELPTRTFVSVQEGARTGQVYQLVHSIVSPQRFGVESILVQAVALRTSIGSNDAADLVSFVVSTTDGTNASPGSLGKMMLLRQMNDTSASINASQQQDFLFSSAVVAPIRLQQELPVIRSAFAIDGRRRYPQTPLAKPVAIDGSRVVLTRSGGPVGVATPIDGFVFSPSSGGASAALIGNMVIGGFTRGAAVKVDGAANVVIDAVTIGQDDQGGRLANQKGVVVTSGAPGQTNGVRIVSSVIGGSTAVGLSLEGWASGVQVYGTRIGVVNASNTVGLSVTSAGVNSIGNVAFGKNYISNNGTGMVLSAGAVTMINTQVSNNAGDGIRIDGGAHAIGRISKPQPRDAYSNEIFGNGGFGVSIRSAAIANNQVVAGNLLGVASANRLGNVAIGGASAAAGSGYVPNAGTGIDTKQNQHKAAAATGPGTTPGRPVVRPVVPIRFPWRARR